MKKKSTVVNQPDKVEANNPELLAQQIHNLHNQKMYRYYAHWDFSHGRVNKFPFGSDRGPLAF